MQTTREGVHEGASSKIVECKWSECGQIFSNLEELGAHVTQNHSSPDEKGLFCCKWDECRRGKRGFNARYKMLVHVRTHTNEKPHKCYQCNKCFSRAENLKIHSRSHTGEKPYRCNVPGCGKCYSNSSDRFKHVRTHSIEKPYFCKIPGCSKRYTDPSSLRKHVKTFKHFPRAFMDVDGIGISNKAQITKSSIGNNSTFEYQQKDLQKFLSDIKIDVNHYERPLDLRINK